MELLRLVQTKVADSIDRLPRYMCTQTIDRSIFQADNPGPGPRCDSGGPKGKMHLVSTDRLRLDVAMAAAMEMYSWVGESRFNDRDLLDMVNEGAISTGAYAAFLTAIFRTEDANFTYNGENGPLSEFGFRIPYEKSHYYFGKGIHRQITAWDGTFLIDPKTAGLVRLEVSTSQLPAETGSCYATTALDYTRVRLQGLDFLLPTASVLKIFNPNAGESVNRTVFSGCHEFLGESKISYEPAPDATHPAAPAASGLTIPEGISFQIAFTQGFDTATNAAGDPVKAKLITPIRSGSKVLVPAGASVGARIVRMRQFYGDKTSLSLEVKLETVEAGGIAIRLSAVPDTEVRVEAKKGRGTLQRRLELGTLRGMEERSASFVFPNIPSPYLIASGLESSWITSAR